MNPLTKRANNVYNVLNDVHKIENYIIAGVAGVIIGAMFAFAI